VSDPGRVIFPGLGYPAPVAVTGNADSPEAEVRGILVAVVAWGGNPSAFEALEDGLRDACVAAWDALARLGTDARSRRLADWGAEAAVPVPPGFSRLHPTWRAEALAGERTEVVALLAAGGADARPLARLAFGHLFPLCEAAPGSVAARLCALTFDDLIVEVTRQGARVVGKALAGAPLALRARAMAAAGEPWAAEIAASAAVSAGASGRPTVAAAVAAVQGNDGRTPSERLLPLGLAALKAGLEAEGHASLLSVAGRLPPALGRRLAGW